MSVPPLLFALACWFFGTAAIVWLDSRPRWTWKWSFAALGLASLCALFAIATLASSASVAAIYGSFGSAILIWGWHELGFLTGRVAGPRRTPCPPELRGWARFRAARATVIHHEIALALTALLLFALTWGQPNQAGPLAFLLLFALRLSAKLNLYLGVSNLSDEVFPAHLAYLKSYFGAARWNWLFPVSLALAGFTSWALWRAAEAASAPGLAAGYTALAGLCALGLVEHLLLMLPLRDAKLWAWAAPKPKTPFTAAPAASSKRR
ncbi:MAG: phosphopantothenate--cysteine ligase [Proteobacteria bacterium SG_bin5]|nr:MAG: phosphopantothenate--cysteine ligase [Proteobacteria bacterium SG_bin5]